MPTVLDTFVIELGLDPRNFTQQQQRAYQDFRRRLDEMRRGASEFEQQTRRAQQMFSRVRNEAVGLLAAFAGAATIKDFVANLVSGDAALGRLSRTTGLSVAEIARWQGAAKLAGGSAEDMAGALLSVQQQTQNFLRTGGGQLPALYGAMTREGGRFVSILQPFGEQMANVAANVEAITKKSGAAAAFWYLQQAGLQGLAPLLMRGEKATRDTLANVEGIGHATKGDTDRAEDLLAKWNAISQLVTNVGRNIFNFGVKAITADTQGGGTHGVNPESWAALPTIWMAKLLSALGVTPENLAPIFGRTLGGAPAGAGGLPLKPGAGTLSPATERLSQVLESLGIRGRITAADDAYHAGLGGAHPAGRALDIALDDPRQSAVVARAIRAKLAEMGIDANVINEYLNPSARSTGGHIHVGLPAGAALGAAASSGQGTTTTSSSTITVNGPITVNTQATDAYGIANGLGAALRDLGNRRLSDQANSGAQ